MILSPKSATLLPSLGLRVENYRGLIGLIGRGLSFRSAIIFQSRSGLSWDELSLLLRLPERTLARRRKAGRLSPAESDRLVRVAQLFERIVRFFDGDVPAARAWLAAPCPALTDETPLALLASETGAGEVERLLGRLEHGVFS